MLAVYMLMTRIIRDKDAAATTTFYSTAVGAFVLSALVPFVWQSLSPGQWGLMLLMGSAGALGHFMLVRAFFTAEASMLAPFTYSQVVASIIWGLLIFADVPSAWTICGALVVSGSGLYVWYREAALRRATS